MERRNEGLTWTFPEQLDYEHPATLVCSDTPGGDRLIAHLTDQGMLESLAASGFMDVGEFWEPWCVALHGEEIASIAITIGLQPASAEVGVTTVPEFRGRGFAAAVTAGWASLPKLRGRTLFYTADKSNVSSQRVPQRLGLRLISANLTIT